MGEPGPRRSGWLHIKLIIVKPGGSVGGGSDAADHGGVIVFGGGFAPSTCCPLNTNQVTRILPKFSVYGAETLGGAERLRLAWGPNVGCLLERPSGC